MPESGYNKVGATGSSKRKGFMGISKIKLLLIDLKYYNL